VYGTPREHLPQRLLLLGLVNRETQATTGASESPLNEQRHIGCCRNDTARTLHAVVTSHTSQANERCVCDATALSSLSRVACTQPLSHMSLFGEVTDEVNECGLTGDAARQFNRLQICRERL
jgi:hypothetical protein